MKFFKNLFKTEANKSFSSYQFKKTKNYLFSLKDEELAKVFSAERNLDGLMAPHFGMLPNSEIQAQFTGLSEEQTFLQAITYLKLCKKKAAQIGFTFGAAPSQTVLDFGCGWGRITQLLALYFSKENILACDVMPSVIELCFQLGLGVHYELLPIWPPSAIEDASLDFIFSYSVFSHLSEGNANAWIKEFSRILKPGGVAFITTRHRSFFDHLKSLHNAENLPIFASGASKAFKNIEDAIQQYDSGQFCFDPQGDGGEQLTQVYGEAFISKKYATEKWSCYFSKIEYEDPIPEGLLDQATIILCK